VQVLGLAVPAKRAVIAVVLAVAASAWAEAARPPRQDEVTAFVGRAVPGLHSCLARAGIGPSASSVAVTLELVPAGGHPIVHGIAAPADSAIDRCVGAQLDSLRAPAYPGMPLVVECRLPLGPGRNASCALAAHEPSSDGASSTAGPTPPAVSSPPAALLVDREEQVRQLQALLLQQAPGYARQGTVAAGELAEFSGADIDLAPDRCQALVLRLREQASFSEEAMGHGLIAELRIQGEILPYPTPARAAGAVFALGCLGRRGRGRLVVTTRTGAPVGDGQFRLVLYDRDAGTADEPSAQRP
jgi:hypothetical protein